MEQFKYANANALHANPLKPISGVSSKFFSRWIGISFKKDESKSP